MTDILVHAGCHGSSGEHVPWVPESRELGTTDEKPWDRKLPTDLQPWDKASPSGQDPIVWRRSIPHGGRWPDIELMVRGLRETGYAVTGVVVTRDRWAALRSQLKWRHVDNLDAGQKRVDQAFEHIFLHVHKAELDVVVVSYESLVHYPAAQDSLLDYLGLDPPAERFPVWDGNQKWYAPEGATERPRTFQARVELVVDDLE